MQSKPVTKMAICYDFDKTLSPDDMQAFEFIPLTGMMVGDFWNECAKLSQENLMERNLTYMYLMLKKAKEKNIPINRERFAEFGKTLKLYEGVEEWFEQINEYGLKHGVQVEHFIISSGLKDIIDGSSIAKHFKKVYASSFYYDESGNAAWAAQAINYTTKTQFIYRIAKGVLEEWDERVNDPMDNVPRDIPYENIIYIGDSDTDIPCMRLVSSKGGWSIGVYDPHKKNKEKVLKLFNEKRINFYSPADYRENKELMNITKRIIKKVSAQSELTQIGQQLAPQAKLFHDYSLIKHAFEENGQKLTEQEKQLLASYEKQINPK